MGVTNIYNAIFGKFFKDTFYGVMSDVVTIYEKCYSVFIFHLISPGSEFPG